MSKQREYLTAISIFKGVITLIEPDGSIGNYRQRGICKLSLQEMRDTIASGYLASNILEYKELPAHYSIAFEDESIMGKAQATFPIKILMKQGA